MSRQEINDTRLAHSRLSGECQLKEDRNHSRISATFGPKVAMTFDQPSTFLSAVSPDNTAFHNALAALPNVNRRDFSGSISPSGSGGGTGSGGRLLLNPASTFEICGKGCATPCIVSATFGSKKVGVLSRTP